MDPLAAAVHHSTASSGDGSRLRVLVPVPDVRLTAAQKAQLRRSRLVGHSALELSSRYGPGNLLSAGYSVAELNQAGFPLQCVLDCGVDPQEALDGGYLIAELEASGFVL
jgi:hypothetical protein